MALPAIRTDMQKYGLSRLGPCCAPAICLIAVTAVLLASCAATGSRGSLSDAAEKARDGHEGSRQVGDTYVSDNEDGYRSGDNHGCLSFCLLGFGFHPENGETGYEPEPVYHSAPEPLPEGTYAAVDPASASRWAPVVAFKPFLYTRYGSLAAALPGAAVSVAGHYDAARWILETGYAAGQVRPGHKLSGSFSDEYVGQLNIAVHYRRYATPDHTFMGIFGELGLNAAMLHWQYANPLYGDVYDEDGNYLETEEINYDALWSIAPEIGIGWSPVQTDYLCLSLIARAGAALYFPLTTAGFDNDILTGDTYLRLEIELAMGSRR